MADESSFSRKEARKLAEKEARRQRKLDKKQYKQDLKDLKREEKLHAAETKKARRTKRKQKRKKYKIKKRFIVIVVLGVAIVAAAVFGMVYAALYLLNTDKDVKDADPNSVESVINENEVFDAAKPAMVYDPEDDGTKTKKPGEILNMQMEYRIPETIISDWHISPLTQTKDIIEATFGELYRYEDWNGGIYYHKGFPDTMYITYNGDVKGRQPAPDAICDSVSICIKNIIEFEPFRPDSSIWGKVNKTKSEEGWTKYFYSLMIKSGVNLIVYCDEDGNIDQETHIIVRKV